MDEGQARFSGCHRDCAKYRLVQLVGGNHAK